jgi:hypothetical protein
MLRRVRHESTTIQGIQGLHRTESRVVQPGGFAGSYEFERFFAVLGGHGVVKAAHGGLAFVFAMTDPVHGHADDGASDHSEIERRVTAHTAAVFSGNAIQPLMQAALNAPIIAIRGEHLFSIHARWRTGGQQELYFRFFGRLARKLNGADELTGLFREGKANAARVHFEGRQRTFFRPPAIDFRGLGFGRLVLRGKKRAPKWNEAGARFFGLRLGCL